MAQSSVPEKTNEITAVPDLGDERALKLFGLGELIEIDAMGCQDYLLPLKGNQPTLEADVEDYFRTAPAVGDGAGGVFLASARSCYRWRD